MARYRFGNKPRRKTWDSSQINQELEEKKLGLLFAGLIVFFVVVFLFLLWMKHMR